MFSDSPKLQPISKSKKIDKKVPLDNGNQSNTNNNKSSSSTNDAAITTSTGKDTYKWVSKDYQPSEKDSRCNFNSYRGNNYRGQNCPKNYNSRDLFNEYTKTNSFPISNNYQNNNFNSYNHWPDWDGHNSNVSYNRWCSSAHSSKRGSYRNTYKYPNGSYINREPREYLEPSFAEDLFEYNSFNSNNIGKIKLKDADSIGKTTKTTAKSSSLKKGLTKKKQTVQPKGKKKNSSNGKPQPWKNRYLTENKNANSSEPNRTEKKATEKPKSSTDYIKENGKGKQEQNKKEKDTNKVAKETFCCQNQATADCTPHAKYPVVSNQKEAQLKARNVETSVQTDGEEFLSTSVPLEKDTLSTFNLSVIALNGSNVNVDGQIENILISSPVNSFASPTCRVNNEVTQLSDEASKQSEDSTVTVLETTAPATAQNSITITSSSQPSNSCATNESDRFDFHAPKISLIPLSRLIATEFWETTCSDNQTQENSLKQPSTPQKAVYKPNLVKRKRNVSTCSNSSTSSQTYSATDRIVEKLVTMNKINIKNIINSSEDTKYDEALKTQARKRLREEIRRQLKSMNISPPKDPINADFTPDEMVDAIDIPDVVFDEIRRVLGLELYPPSKDDKTAEELLTTNSTEDASPAVAPKTPKNISIMVTNSETASSDVAALDKVPQQEDLTQPQPPLPPQPPQSPPSTPTVKCEIKTENISHAEQKRKLPENPVKAKKLTKRKESRKSKRHRSSKKPESTEDVVVLISSSSSSESSSSSSSSCSSSTSSSSSSSSDSESDASPTSSTSLVKTKRRKQKLDAENVVDSFEKLILSSLSENLRERYRSKYSTSIKTKLHFISCICTSDYNIGKFSKLQIAKVQKNLKSSDCSMALEFLMKEIVNVFHKQKQVAKQTDESNKTSRILENSPQTEPTKDAAKELENNANMLHKSLQPASDSEKTKSTKAADKRRQAASNEKNIQQCVSKVLALYRQEMKAAMQANVTKNQPSSIQKTRTTTEGEENNSNQQQQEQQTSIQLTSSNNPDKNAGHAKPNEDEAHLQNPINCINQPSPEQHQTVQQQIIANSHDKQTAAAAATAADSLTNVQQQQQQQQQQQHCVETATEKLTTPIIPIHNFCSTDFVSGANGPSCILNSNLNSAVLGYSSSSYTPQPSFPFVDLDELRKQSPIGEVVVNNLREIDVKLMELHKRKMYLEEMILKLQKDKMEADLLTIKLQNEKFILLNTAMTANVTSTALKNNNNNANNNLNSRPQETFSSFKTIKTETTKTNGLAVSKELESGKNHSESKTSCKSPTAKKIASSNSKRKPPSTAPTSEAAKRRKPSNQATTKKSCSKKPSKSSTTTPKQSSVLSAETSSELPAEQSAVTPCSTGSIATESPASATSHPETTDQLALVVSEATAALSLSQTAEQTTEHSNHHPGDGLNYSLYKSMPTGNFEGIHNPVTQIRIFEKFIVASSEDGKLLKFDVSTLKQLEQFTKHTEAITQMYLCPERKVIYTTSLDGYLKKSSLENLSLDVKSIYLQEPLQSIDIQWDIAYIGSRWGNIYSYNVVSNSLADKPLCSTDSSIISIKATEEGPQKILIVSSKGNFLHLRDAMTGQLIRRFDVPEPINIYSILLNDGVIYCGTQKREIRKYDFESGRYLGFMSCGNGAVSMQMYNNKYILVGCYDGYIYILDKISGKQKGRLAGSGKMILTLEIVEDKIITSAKDNTMKVKNIPSYCLKDNTQT